jgi:ubiquinone/menaquinone biosynthesis C-methylase UbiE
VQRLRAAATELLAPRSGHRLVDVGCGIGDVARSLASLVGPDGTVLGIDPSRTMITEARRRSHEASTAIEFRVGDITGLDLEDESVDGPGANASSSTSTPRPPAPRRPNWSG